jgi:hypothetical protein
MAKMLPKWLTQRYLLMMDKFGTEQFNFEGAKRLLKPNFSDSDQLVSLVLSMLKGSGWLNVEIDPTDSRKRLYSLSKMYKEDVFKELVAETKAEIKKGRT